MFIVYRNINDPNDCLVVEESTVVPAIYAKVFGPAAEVDCINWKNKNCGETSHVLEDSEVEYFDQEGFLSSKNDVASLSTFEVTKDQEFIPRVAAVNLNFSSSLRTSQTFHVNGKQGAHVKISLSFYGLGGHRHGTSSRDPNAVGRTSPSSFVLTDPYPQNVPVVWTVGLACGEVLHTAVFSNPDGSVDVRRVVATISRPGLQALTSSTGIVLVGQTGSHGSNHWGTPTLCSALKNLASAFHIEFKKPIFINDMSLPWGGLFDINGNFRTPHAAHDEGRNVDINFSSMNEKEAAFFRTTAQSLTFTVLLHGTPLHWHLTI